MFGELLQTNEYNEKRAPNNGQPSKIAVQKAKKKGFEIALKADFGRGDKIRTCDFYVPNVALYQAEPHLDGGFLGFFCKWSNMWSDHLHREYFKIGYCQNMQCFQGVSAVWEFLRP